MKEQFEEIRFQHKTVARIAQANQIIAEYQQRGLVMTCRQIFYQFVARGWLENSQQNYNNLNRDLRNGRLTGLIDWDAIEDLTRERVTWRSYASPEQALRRCAETYHEDPWREQPYRPEVWIEKDALSGVIEGVCNEYRVPYVSCRGNVSHSLIYRSAKSFANTKRFVDILRQGQKPIVLYLGDHDPNGIDMSRDIGKRLNMFARSKIELKRLALNLNQVRGLPPNSAKETDSRYEAYVREFGTTDCWELDALSPDVIVNLIRTALKRLIDQRKWTKAQNRERRNRKKIARMASR